MESDRWMDDEEVGVVHLSDVRYQCSGSMLQIFYRRVAGGGEGSIGRSRWYGTCLPDQIRSSKERARQAARENGTR